MSVLVAVVAGLLLVALGAGSVLVAAVYVRRFRRGDTPSPRGPSNRGSGGDSGDGES